MIKHSELQFERDSTSVVGFASHNRASTDAINALEKWKMQASARTYDITEDGDEVIQIRLEYVSEDSTAGDDLDQSCRDHGVCRHAIT